MYQMELKQSLQCIAERMAQMDVREACIRKFMEQAKGYLKMPKLTPELLRVFICKIEVFEKLEKYSRTAGNLIVIHYTFQLPEENGLPALEKVLPKQVKTA